MAKTLKAIFGRNAGSGTHMVKRTVSSSTASMVRIRVPLEHSELTDRASNGFSVSSMKVGAGTPPQAARSKLAVIRSPRGANNAWRFTISPPIGLDNAERSLGTLVTRLGDDHLLSGKSYLSSFWGNRDLWRSDAQLQGWRTARSQVL